MRLSLEADSTSRSLQDAMVPTPVSTLDGSVDHLDSSPLPDAWKQSSQDDDLGHQICDNGQSSSEVAALSAK